MAFKEKPRNALGWALPLVITFVFFIGIIWQKAYADSTNDVINDEFSTFRRQLEKGHGALPPDIQTGQDRTGQDRNRTTNAQEIPLIPARECDDKLMRPSYPIFRGVRRVAFELLVPDSINNLKKYQNDNPQVLRPDYLTKIILERIQERIMPLVERPKDCSIQKPTDITGTWNTSWITGKKDTLTIIMKVSVTGQENSRVATISMNYFRPQFVPTATTPTPIWLIEQTSVPFSLPDKEMKNALKEFIDNLWTDNTFYADFASP